MQLLGTVHKHECAVQVADSTDQIIFDIAVVIVTYNGEERLPLVLDCLKACWAYTQASGDVLHQPINTIGPDDRNVSWEILIVDNNSSDLTRQVVESYQANWFEGCPLRYTHEAQQGAGFARQRGIREAQANLIAFLDDDNLPNPDWIIAAYQFAQQHPKAGAFGSQIHGGFEIEPPPELHPILPFLAIVERGPKPLLYNSWKRVLPPSAGLVVRKQAWLNSVPERCILGGRTHKSMLTGEDTEAIAHIQQKGWEIWYNPAMQLWHKIPAWRLQREYLIPFFRGIGLSRSITRTLGYPIWLHPIILFAYLLNDCRKLASKRLQYSFGTRRNLTAECEITLARYSILSPFFFLAPSLLRSRK